MPGDEELGFEAAVAALGECMISLAYSTCLSLLLERDELGQAI